MVLAKRQYQILASAHLKALKTYNLDIVKKTNHWAGGLNVNCMRRLLPHWPVVSKAPGSTPVVTKQFEVA